MPTCPPLSRSAPFTPSSSSWRRCPRTSARPSRCATAGSPCCPRPKWPSSISWSTLCVGRPGRRSRSPFSAAPLPCTTIYCLDTSGADGPEGHRAVEANVPRTGAGRRRAGNQMLRTPDRREVLWQSEGCRPGALVRRRELRQRFRPYPRQGRSVGGSVLAQSAGGDTSPPGHGRHLVGDRRRDLGARSVQPADCDPND